MEKVSHFRYSLQDNSCMKRISDIEIILNNRSLSYAEGYVLTDAKLTHIRIQRDSRRRSR